MIQLGEYNELAAKRQTDNGWYLVDDEDNEVLMPKKYVPENCEEGTQVNVFVYKDSEDRIVATTDTPLISINEFAFLEVKDVNKFGAFLEWGMEKDLMVPFSEQQNRISAGDSVVVRLVLDEKTERLYGTTRLNKYLVTEHIVVKEGEEVDAIIIDESDLGFKAIIEDAHQGLLYKSETFRTLEIGDKLKVWVKKIRADGKIDLSLQQQGYESIEPAAQKILDALEKNDGFLGLHDKSHPLEIAETLHMSKKVFKKALGTLYSKRLISLEDKGIRSVKK